MKPRVYVETTIPSYLTAWPSRNLIRAAHQQVTREWWARRAAFDLYVSRLVYVECEAGDPTAAADRVAAINGLPSLVPSREAAVLTAALIVQASIPLQAEADAAHVAISAVNRMKYLLTWNCRHLANVTLRPRIEAVCRANGYEPPLICTPLELPAPEDKP